MLPFSDDLIRPHTPVSPHLVPLVALQRSAVLELWGIIQPINVSC